MLKIANTAPGARQTALVRFLMKKLLRDVGHSKGQYVATIAVVLLGVAFYVGMMSASASVNTNIDAFYANQKLADFWVSVPQASPSLVSQIQGLSGVQAVDARAQLAGTAGTHSFVVNTITDNPTVNIPFLESGQLPSSSAYCIVDRGYAAANDLSIGAQVDVLIAGQNYQLTVSGVFNSPEYLYLARDVTAQPDHQTYGALFVSPALLPNQPANQILVRAQPGADLVALKAQITQIAVGGGPGVVIDHTQILSWVMLNQDMTQYGQIGVVFPVIFFLVAAAIIFISMSKNVETQRGQIGNMKALGISNGLITFHFLSYTLLTCLVGCVFGAIIGVLVVMPGIEMIFTAFYTMPAMHAVGFAGNTAAAALLAFAFGIAATVVSVRRPLRESPAAAMRPKVPRAIKPILLERYSWLWQKLSFGHKIVLRNLFLNKGRALLSSIGIIGCVGLLVASFCFLASIRNVLGPQFFNQNRYDIAVTMNTSAAPGDQFAHMSQDISAAWGMGAVAASFTQSDVTTTTNLMAFDVNCDATGLYDSKGARLGFDDTGVIVPKLWANKYKLAIGDTIALTLSPPGGTPQTVNVMIAAIAVEYLEQDIYTSFGYLDSLGITLPVATYYLDVNPGVSPDTVAASLNQQSDVAKAVTKATLANSWQSELGIMNSMMFIMIGASAVLALAVVYNISAINIAQRRRDIATLKVLGYRRNEVNRLVFEENLLITGFGAVLGIPVGVAMLALIIAVVVSDTMMVPMVVQPTSIVYAVALGFVFTWLANQLLRRQIGRIDMVESLKSIE